MLDNSSRLIHRSGFEGPKNYDTLEYLTLCSCGYDSDIESWEYYIQLSKDSENPKWFHLGKLKDQEILIKLIDILK